MKTKVKLYLALLLVGFLGATAIAFGGGDTVAQQEEGGLEEQIEQAAPEEEHAEEEGEQVDQTGKFVYVTQPGDSYTLMARKAVQTYGKKFDVQVSPAGIIYAETNLTLVAGSPHLEVGQEVSIDEALVKDWVDRAQALSDNEEAAWEYYVQFVDFNTDRVGEAS